MQPEALFISVYGVCAALISARGWWQTTHCNNPYGLVPQLIWWGAFVWGDAMILGAFWAVVSAASLLFVNFKLFFLVQSLFWIVRSSGEIIYWFLQQFATNKRDEPHTLWGQALFPGESVWFAYQLMWELVLVVAILSLLYQLGFLTGFSNNG